MEAGRRGEVGAGGLGALIGRRLVPQAAALPGAPHDLQIAICAPERVTDPPDEVITITADDIFDTFVLSRPLISHERVTRG